jgi:hypothetical protein
LYPYLNYLTDFHASLLGNRLITTLGLAICFLGIWLESLRGRILSLIPVLFIFVLYIFWYFEKFDWLEAIGAKQGTTEYKDKLIEIGYFRGANEWDYILLFSVLLLMFWIIFRYHTNQPKSLQ